MREPGGQNDEDHGLRQKATSAPSPRAHASVLRVVVTADNHLSAYIAKLTPQRLSERRRRLRHAFGRVVDEAIARHAHVFIQAGDLFDNTDPLNIEREFVAMQLGRLRAAGIHAFGVSGNHDTPRQRTEHGGYSPAGIYAQLDALHYFPDSHRISPVGIDVGGVRVAVAGLSNNPGAAPGGDPLDKVEVDDPGNRLATSDIRMLVLHAAIEGHGFPSEEESIVRRASIAQLSHFQLILAGHVHAYKRFHIGEKTVVVCGPTERMEFGENEGSPGFAYLELTATGLRTAEHIPIPPQPRHVVTMRTTELWPTRQHPSAHTGTDSPPQYRQGECADGFPDMSPPDVPTEKGNHPDETLPSATFTRDETDERSATTAEPQDPTARIIERIEPSCTSEAMVRLRLEGPVTREQYRSLDLRKIWLIGQRQAFSFEIDESSLFLASIGPKQTVARGERIAPHATLEQVAYEWMERAETADERTLLAKTRERILIAYSQLTGRETGE